MFRIPTHETIIMQKVNGGKFLTVKLHSSAAAANPEVFRMYKRVYSIEIPGTVCSMPNIPSDMESFAP